MALQQRMASSSEIAQELIEAYEMIANHPELSNTMKTFLNGNILVGLNTLRERPEEFVQMLSYLAKIQEQAAGGDLNSIDLPPLPIGIN